MMRTGVASARVWIAAAASSKTDAVVHAVGMVCDGILARFSDVMLVRDSSWSVTD